MEIGEETFLKEFGKDFYHPLYLSRFKIPEKRVEISAIIPTYNRCPFKKNSDNYEYNPLYLAIRALLLQKNPINEIIVIDDNSNDYTLEVVKDLQKEAYSSKGVEIRYFKNKERKGSSISRNIGAKNAKSKYLFFLDDDCIPTPYLSFISMKVIREIEKIDKNFSVLVLPVYDRASYPRVELKIEDLNKSFFKRGSKSASFNSMPLEYLNSKKKYLNKNLKILKPIQVYQTWGHFIIDRKKYLDVGGFPDFATWPNKAGEEQEFACRLIENAYTLYYLPGIKASSFHGAFGAKIGYFKGIDWLAELTNKKSSLIKFSKICNSNFISGNRVNVDDYFYSKIIARFCIIYKRNIKEAINWAKLSYEEFVVQAKLSWFRGYASTPIKDRKKREEIWYRALYDGLNLLLRNEEEKTIKLNNFINSLRRRGRLEEEREKNLIKELIKRITQE